MIEHDLGCCGRTAAGGSRVLPPPAITTHIMTAALSHKENKKMHKTTDSRYERAKIGRLK